MIAPAVRLSKPPKARQPAPSGSIGSGSSTPDNARPPPHPAALGWREEMIRQAAYFRSQHRAPCPGKELEDWLAAEQAIDNMIACGGAPYA